MIIFVALSVLFMVLSSMSGITDGLLNSVEKEFSRFAGFSPVQLLAVIFSKNIIACLFVAFTSCYLLGLPIFFSLLTNTAIIGGFLSIYPEFIIGILPHGVIEIPALCISFALGWHIWRRKGNTWLKISRGDVAYFLRVVVPLLLVAALIEVFITPAVISWFLPVGSVS